MSEVKKKILIVDDEEDVRDMLDELFRIEGYDTVTASNGKEGLDIYKKFSPELVITDIRMPVMDGVELVENLRSLNKNIKVVYITGWESSQSRHKRDIINDSDFKYLKKPFELAEIVRVVNEYINK